MFDSNASIKHLMAAGVILAAGLSDSAFAGETIKFRAQHVVVSGKFEATELGDEVGHISGLFTGKGIGVRRVGPAEAPYKIDVWGGGEYHKDGTGRDRGYGKFTFSDGSYYLEEWVGTVANGRDVGTAVYYGGSGRFKGMRGGSKFDCQLMGDRLICEVEGTIELP